MWGGGSGVLPPGAKYIWTVTEAFSRAKAT